MADSKINLIYYKNILDNVLSNFFTIYNDSFSKNGDVYVMSRQISRSSLKREIRDLICMELKKYVSEYSILSPRYYFVIGSCRPCDNILLMYEDHKNPIPLKLKKMINTHRGIKYFLKEDDIRIDIEEFNCIFEEIFDRYFKHHNVIKDLGNGFSNLFFIKNSHMDCYTTYRIIKDIFGRINTYNIHKGRPEDMKDVLVSFNELIGKRITHKKEICRGNDLEMMRKEIKQYIDNCIFGNNG